ncbi:MAG TPA: hypothetical protein VL240_14480 [Candidatus Binatia bacterium]|nr:hypothetical protein [Candidatus Binatia bacterium]
MRQILLYCAASGWAGMLAGIFVMNLLGPGRDRPGRTPTQR